jgi:hypothetical protein
VNEATQLDKEDKEGSVRNIPGPGPDDDDVYLKKITTRVS